MKAEEARKIADNEKATELEEVLKTIRLQATVGEYRAYFYHHLNEQTVNGLKELGYGYTSSFDRNEILVIVSW